MSEFKQFNQKLRENFEKITENATHLFQVDLDKDALWELYLESFPPGTNEIYKERREYDCSCCRHFVKQFGNVVVIEEGTIKTVWGFDAQDETFQAVIDQMNLYVMTKPIEGVYMTREKKIGTESNREMLDSGQIITWHHFAVDIPDKFVTSSSETLGTLAGEYRAVKEVFKRSLDELTANSVETVLELIKSNTLYKGAEWLNQLQTFLRLKEEYIEIANPYAKDIFAWEMSVKVGPVIGKIRNHSIGQLLQNLSGNMDLETAVKKYEDIVAGPNYKRPKALFTPRMLEDAKKTVVKLGYSESLGGRRHAILDDISVNDVLFSNVDAQQRMVKDDLFEDMKSQAVKTPMKFERLEEIGIQNFIDNVLPTADELELYLENIHESKMVSLIAPIDQDAKTMFKWGNNFGWAYSGNMAASFMKDRVKSAGGTVEGDLRFSIQWNDREDDQNDLDAHCIESTGFRIYFNNKGVNSPNGGMLDVDIQNPRDKVAVENIIYKDRKTMVDGEYKFIVHNYANRGGRDGFRAEIEFDGVIHSFDYPHEVKDEEYVVVANVTLKDGQFSIKTLLPSKSSSKEIWGLKTNDFIPVSVVMYSPNFWDQSDRVGHQHVFFMLKDCINDQEPNGFYNEFLDQRLNKHRKVFEAIGARLKVEKVEDQLSGVGFSMTERSEVIVKVKGNTERVFKVKL